MHTFSAVYPYYENSILGYFTDLLLTDTTARRPVLLALFRFFSQHKACQGPFPISAWEYIPCYFTTLPKKCYANKCTIRHS